MIGLQAGVAPEAGPAAGSQRIASGLSHGVAARGGSRFTAIGSAR